MIELFNINGMKDNDRASAVTNTCQECCLVDNDDSRTDSTCREVTTKTFNWTQKRSAGDLSECTCLRSAFNVTAAAVESATNVQFIGLSWDVESTVEGRSEVKAAVLGVKVVR